MSHVKECGKAAVPKPGQNFTTMLNYVLQCAKTCKLPKRSRNAKNGLQLFVSREHYIKRKFVHTWSTT